MNKKGSVIIALLAVLTCSAICLSLLAATTGHIKSSGYRIRRIKSLSELHEELTAHIHKLKTEYITSEILHTYIEPWSDFLIKENFNTINCSPFTIDHNFRYTGIARKTYRDVTEYLTLYAGSANSVYSSTAYVKFSVLKGRVPLCWLPLLITSSDMYDSISDFTADKNITISSDTDYFYSNTDTSPLIDTDSFLKEIFNTDSFLTWSVLRQKLGIDIEETKPENGIYVKESKNYIDLIYIQGNVDKLIFSYNSGIQKIKFIMPDSTVHTITYSAAKPDTDLTWSPESRNKLFRENIVINGNVNEICQEGEYAFSSSSSLTLYITGKTLINNNIVKFVFSEHEKLISSVQIINGPNTLFKSDNNSIVLTGKNVSIDLNVISTGKVINNTEKLTVRGSLCADSAENLNNTEIVLCTPQKTSLFFLSPDVTLVKNFIIEAVQDE